jgi:hypothetical protein
MVEGEDETTDENGITVMGVLSTLQTILGLVEDHAEIVTRVEPMVHQLILRILDAFATGLFFYRIFGKRSSLIFNVSRLF